MPRSLRSLLLPLLLLLGASGPALGSGEAAPRGRFAGTYIFAGGAPEQAARDAAISKAVESLFFLIRPLARSRLDVGKPVPPLLSFAFSDGKITVIQSGRPPATSPEDGTPTALKAHLTVTQRFDPEGHLVQSFVTPEGARTNVYVLAPDGRTVQQNVEVISGRLPKPLRFSLTYRKQ